MKPYDHVRVIRDKDKYLARGVSKGRTGYIIEDKIDEYFLLQFFNKDCSDSVIIEVKEEDLEVIPDDE